MLKILVVALALSPITAQAGQLWSTDLTYQCQARVCKNPADCLSVPSSVALNVGPDQTLHVSPEAPAQTGQVVKSYKRCEREVTGPEFDRFGHPAPHLGPEHCFEGYEVR